MLRIRQLLQFAASIDIFPIPGFVARSAEVAGLIGGPPGEGVRGAASDLGDDDRDRDRDAVTRSPLAQDPVWRTGTPRRTTVTMTGTPSDRPELEARTAAGEDRASQVDENLDQLQTSSGAFAQHLFSSGGLQKYAQLSQASPSGGTDAAYRQS